MNVLAVLAVVLLVLSGSASADKRTRTTASSSPILASLAPQAAAASWVIDASKPLIHVSPDLYGVFFEEINHGGTGGMWAQQIQNSNFEDTRGMVAPWTSLDSGVKYQMVLDEQMPINAINPVSLQVVSDMGGDMAGVLNPGWYGINVSDSLAFDGSLYVRSATIRSIDVALVDSDTGKTVYATTTLMVGQEWRRHNFSLMAKGNGLASLRITWKPVSKADRINFDVVTLFPRKGWKGLPWMRPDLAQAVADLHPAFIRFPGGCFVEGQIIANRFNWKHAIGPIEHRAGHWNLWGYWNEDGMAYFEFLQFIERMTDAYGNPTRAIWVVNNGISHDESIGVEDIQPYVQDALDSLEFAMGAADSYWGAQRVAMGHEAPFPIWALAIGNEDCGKPSYVDNYQKFYDQISAAWPQVKLISNCDPTDRTMSGHPTQMWDYHIYASAEQLFRQGATFFDQPHWRTASNAKVFNSEYATTTGGGHGNAGGALGEAAWMNGLERNSDLVTTASYAPLFVNTAASGYKWEPDAINFNSAQWFGIPSYWNQWMYATSFMGCVNGSVQTLSYQLTGATNVSVAVAIGTLNAMEQSVRASNVVLVHKIVNFQGTSTPFSISVENLPSSAKLNTTLDVTVMMSDDPMKENSYDNPTAVAPMMTTIKVDGPAFTVTLAPWSVYVVKAYASL